MKRSRLKSPVAWTSIAAVAVYILKSLGLLKPLGLTEDCFKEAALFIIGVLTAVGVFHEQDDSEEKCGCRKNKRCS